MNNLERYLDQVIEQRPEIQELPPEEPSQETPPNFLKSIRRRWYIVLLVTIVVCGVGVPAVWYLVEPLYVVRGAVRFAQGVENPVTGEYEGTGTTYQVEVTRQALMMTGGTMLRNIANELADRNLEFFSGKPQTLISKLKAKIFHRESVVAPEEILRNAVTSEVITAGPIRDTDLLGVTMKSRNLAEAKQIVNTILSTFEATYKTNVTNAGAVELDSLNKEKTRLEESIRQQRLKIREDANAYGTTVLDPFQQMELQVQTVLRTRLIGLKAEIIRAEANVDLLKQDLDKLKKDLKEASDVNMPPTLLVTMRQEYVNKDPMIQQLEANILDMERNLMISKRTMQPGHPTLKQQEEILVDFRAKLVNRRDDLTKEFNQNLADQREALAQQKLDRAEAELRSMRAQEAELEKTLNTQSQKAIAIGQKGLDLADAQFELRVDMEYLDTISRRIKKMALDDKRDPRVEPAIAAEYVEMEDRRVKLAMTVVFGAVAAGCALAFLRDKMDKTLQTPDDVTRHLGLPLLGTTTSSRAVKPTRFAEQIAGDYQTIRANLGLLSNEGIPRKLAVGSSGMREGKTTFAVNLATSLAKSGKRVLLIDGDLRKPDVGNMLNIPNDLGGVQEVLQGEDPSQLIYEVPESGLHVLAANPRSMADAYELLASSMAVQQLDRLGREYDHIIVDTPPALAFPDALVWAKLTDAVILVGFAGQTTAPDLKEAKERFKRARVQVLGAILSNVTSEHGLYRYGYGYRAGEAPITPRGGRQRKMLLPTQGHDNDISS